MAIDIVRSLIQARAHLLILISGVTRFGGSDNRAVFVLLVLILWFLALYSLICYKICLCFYLYWKLKLNTLTVLAQRATVNVTGLVGLWVSIPIWRNKILNIFISSLWEWGKTWRWVPPISTQYLQNSAASGERKCLNTRFQCSFYLLPC